MSGARLTERGRLTRQRIVEATGEQILAAGIGGTSLDDVRAATLTSKSQLFHYFPGGKLELVRAVAEWEGAQLLAAQEPEIYDLSTRASWQRWRDALVDYYIGRGRWACPIGSLVAEAAHTDPDLAAMLTAAFAEWRDLLAAGVTRMQAGGARPDADPTRMVGPKHVATAILAAIQGGLLLSQSERDPWPLQAALDQSMHSLDSPEVEIP